VETALKKDKAVLKRAHGWENDDWGSKNQFMLNPKP
jgi:hypothetical protein